MMGSMGTRRLISRLVSRHRRRLFAPSPRAPPLSRRSLRCPPAILRRGRGRRRRGGRRRRMTARSPTGGRARLGVAGDYEEEQTLVLRAALPHVVRLGWSESAMIAGARDVGVSPSIVGTFPRKEAALVESQPMNLPTSIKQRAMLVDEIWHAARDAGSDIDWYVKRTVLGGIYSTSEVYMVTDNSPELGDTWLFVDRRIKDALDLEKTIQEAANLAEAVGARVGSSMQGFLKRAFQG